MGNPYGVRRTLEHFAAGTAVATGSAAAGAGRRARDLDRLAAPIHAMRTR